MPPSKHPKSTVSRIQKSKCKPSTLTPGSFPGSSASKTLKPLVPLSSFGASEKTIKPLTSLVKPPTLQSDGGGKGKGKEKAPLSTHQQTEQITIEQDEQLWVDKYEPQTEADLAVHKRKVEDVRRWLNDAFEGGPTGAPNKYRRILALTGHAGTGKTATLRVLAHEMGFEILEWRNSVDDNFSGDGVDYERESLTSKFQTFLTRASSCRALPLFSDTASSSSVCSPARQVILLEDLPNVLHSGTAEAFHSALEDYLATPPGTPLIFIISDAGTRGEDPESDLTGGRTWGKWDKQAIDVRSIVPPFIFRSPYFTEIQFNPIAPTLLVKALTNLLTQHFSSGSAVKSKSSSTAQPSKEIVQIIVDSAYGDIRSAIMALQFACLVQLPKGKRKLEARSVLEAVTRREQSLALFHMLGKVLYNKRKGDSPNSSASAKDREREKELDARIPDEPALPAHLKEHARRGSRVDINTLYADSPIDTSLFALYLHQNYTQFCNGVDECDTLCEWLSWIDVSGGETWEVQQNPHQFHILALGTLHSLPSPVPRQAQKIFKPEFFDVLKKRRAAEDAVLDTESWINMSVLNEMEGARRWTRDEVVLELGGVLKAMDGCRLGDLPPTHKSFTALTFVHPLRMPGNSQRMEQLDEGEGPAQEFSLADVPGVSVSRKGHVQDLEDPTGGWLEDDDIHDF